MPIFIYSCAIINVQLCNAILLTLFHTTMLLLQYTIQHCVWCLVFVPCYETVDTFSCFRLCATYTFAVIWWCGIIGPCATRTVSAIGCLALVRVYLLICGLFSFTYSRFRTFVLCVMLLLQSNVVISPPSVWGWFVVWSELGDITKTG